MSSILTIAHPDKPEALRLADAAAAEFRRRGHEVCQSSRLDDDLSGEAPALAVVFGGDGTVLGAVARLGRTPPPILAFNCGRLGYLAENSPGQLHETIDLALAGGLQHSRRMMLEATMRNGRGEEWRATALNEFVLTSSRHVRLLPISVWVDDEQLMDFRSDGVIVATPTGSTAYALAAGGPVASPSLSALILAPICPHQLANRPLVLDPGETVRLRHHGDVPVDLVADGRLRRLVERGIEVAIRMSEITVCFLSPRRSRYTVLREKLGWGGWRMEESGNPPEIHAATT